jgi:ribonuclease G
VKRICIETINGVTRTALLEGSRLREIFIDRAVNGSLVGNIYVGVVRNILPSQFAFIDIGTGGKNAFLNIPKGMELRTGEPVPVQVYKDASGAKGAYVGQELFFNGRLVIVHAPLGDTGSPSIGISKKITQKKERKRLQGIVQKNLAEGYGAIIRTNAAGKDEADIAAEIRLLTDKHALVLEKARYARPPVTLCHENNLLKDLLSDDVEDIWVNDKETLEAVTQAVAYAAPGLVSKVRLYEDGDMFHRLGINRQISHALQKDVTLPCGGYITIEQTEACVIVDVNTGHFAGKRNFRETVMQTNLEAAACIAWQMALRNLSGMIIVDFIDMQREEDKAALIREFTACIKQDRIQTEIVGMTELGLVQLTRKKTRESLSRLLETECTACKGKGKVAADY